MDKLNNYRAIVKQILNDLVNYGSSPGQIDEYAVCDEKTDNYILSNVGSASQRSPSVRLSDSHSYQGR